MPIEIPEQNTSATPDDVREAVVIGNLKSVAEQPAMLSNLAFANLVSNVNLSQQNAVSNQQAMNQLALTVTGKIVNLLANLSPLEAAAATHLFTGNETAEDIADLKAADEAFSAPPAPAPEGGGESGGL